MCLAKSCCAVTFSDRVVIYGLKHLIENTYLDVDFVPITCMLLTDYMPLCWQIIAIRLWLGIVTCTNQLIPKPDKFNTQHFIQTAILKRCSYYLYTFDPYSNRRDVHIHNSPGDRQWTLFSFRCIQSHIILLCLAFDNIKIAQACALSHSSLHHGCLLQAPWKTLLLEQIYFSKF